MTTPEILSALEANAPSSLIPTVQLRALVEAVERGAPDGWVLVPRGPYEAWKAAADAWRLVASQRTNLAVLVSSDRLRGAIAASPDPPVGGGGARGRAECQHVRAHGDGSVGGTMKWRCQDCGYQWEGSAAYDGNGRLIDPEPGPPPRQNPPGGNMKRRAKDRGHSDDGQRGTGRTTAQMKEAPEGATFVWCSETIQPAVELARKLGRGDLKIVGPDIFYHPRMLVGVAAVIVDHAFWELARPEQKDGWHEWMERCGYTMAPRAPHRPDDSE